MSILRNIVRARVAVATIAVACVVACTLIAARPASAETDAVLYRIFLKDGSTLVSYGEFVKMDDRVVFSFPLQLTSGEPKLQLVSIPTSAVNWQDTDRYTESARYAHYVATRAEDDFAAMSSDVACALNDIALTTHPAARLQIAERARRTLIEWPRTNLGYRAADIRQIVMLLDEVVSELRVAQVAGSLPCPWSPWPIRSHGAAAAGAFAGRDYPAGPDCRARDPFAGRAALPASVGGRAGRRRRRRPASCLREGHP